MRSCARATLCSQITSGEDSLGLLLGAGVSPGLTGSDRRDVVVDVNDDDDDDCDACDVAHACDAAAAAAGSPTDHGSSVPCMCT